MDLSNEKMDLDHVEELKHVDTAQAFHRHPVPSNQAEDPLNWPFKLKLGTWNTAAINAAFGPLSKDLHISEVKASWSTTVVIALNGVGPFIWIPLANVYGRRAVYLVTTAIGFATALGSGFSTNFGSLVGVRAINGIFPVSMALGPATVTDVFFYHQRGRATGIFTVFLTSGAHFAGLFGGPVGQFLGWRWIFYITAMINFATLAFIAVFLPETIYYSRGTHPPAIEGAEPKLTMSIYKSLLKPWTTFTGVKLHARHFVLPSFRMARYPSVIFPALYYATQYCFAAIFPAVTYATIFRETYGWNTLQCGLAYGGTMTIGSIAGECVAGVVMDRLLKHESERTHDNSPAPEVRLKGIWSGAILVPAGLLIFGFTMQHRTLWAGPLAGMFIGIFGVQIVATCTYTYSIDCYRIEGSEVSQLFNFLRQETSMTVAFYGVDLCHAIGFDLAFLMFALVGGVLAFLPILWLMWKGQCVREDLGMPEKVSVAEEVILGHVTTRVER